MSQKITIQNCRIGHHSFGNELHFAPGEVKEVELAILCKYGNPPSEFARGEFKVITEREKAVDFYAEPAAPAKPLAPEAPVPTTEAELAALLNDPPKRK